MTDEMKILSRTHCTSPTQRRGFTNHDSLKRSEVFGYTWQPLQSFAIVIANIFKRGCTRIEALWKSHQLWKSGKIE